MEKEPQWVKLRTEREVVEKFQELSKELRDLKKGDAVDPVIKIRDILVKMQTLAWVMGQGWASEAEEAKARADTIKSLNI